MKAHVVKAGESLWSIARVYGFDDWSQIYEHPSNAVFRKLRPDPTLIRPGDHLFIPDAPFRPRIAGKARPAQRAQPAIPFGPPVAPPAAISPASAFEEYLSHVSKLEQAAIAQGHTSLVQRITDFRLIYYPNGSPAKTILGVVVGGSAWNILIPGATSAREPQSWSSGELAASRAFLAAHQVVDTRRGAVDLGHLLAGLDAGNHPAQISLGGIVTLNSNMAAATYAGDLGSVVGEYILGFKGSVYDLASKLNHQLLTQTYNSFISPEDTAGNADAYALTENLSLSVAQNLTAYYQEGSQGVDRRYKQFNTRASLSNRQRVDDLVFNSALAYVASKGHRDQAIAVTTNPGPVLFGYSLWDAYYNVTKWTVDVFLSRLRQAMDQE